MVPLLSTLNIFPVLFWCFYCWLWRSHFVHFVFVSASCSNCSINIWQKFNLHIGWGKWHENTVICLNNSPDKKNHSTGNLDSPQWYIRLFFFLEFLAYSSLNNVRQDCGLICLTYFSHFKKINPLKYSEKLTFENL